MGFADHEFYGQHGEEERQNLAMVYLQQTEEPGDWMLGWQAGRAALSAYFDRLLSDQELYLRLELKTRVAVKQLTFAYAYLGKLSYFFYLNIISSQLQMREVLFIRMK